MRLALDEERGRTIEAMKEAAQVCPVSALLATPLAVHAGTFG